MNIITDIAYVTIRHRLFRQIGMITLLAMLGVSFAQAQSVLKVQLPKKNICSTDANCRPVRVDLEFPKVEMYKLTNPSMLSLSIDLQNDGMVDRTGRGAVFSKNLPRGTHLIKWTAENQQWAQLITVSDCQKPTARSIQGTALDIGKKEEKRILWASDVNQFSTDNCGIEELRLALSPKDGKRSAIPNYDHIAFGCDDLGKHTVDLWVRDAAGQWDYCTTSIFVTNSNGTCLQTTSPTAPIAFEETPPILDQPQAPILSQNAPNPFRELTHIGFVLKESDNIRLQVSDISGKVVKVIEDNFSKGYHKIMLKQSDFPSSGLYFYQLDTSFGSLTKKMQLID